MVLIGRPPYVAFSQLQTLIPDTENKRRQLADGMRHMEFVAKLYRNQVEGEELSSTRTPPMRSRGAPGHQEDDAGSGS